LKNGISDETSMTTQVCFVNGRVVNVYSGEILKQEVKISGDRIGYVGPSIGALDEDTACIDVKGAYLLPGYFDAHAHADLFYNPFSYADAVLTRGTTTLFNDGHDLANAVGADPFLKIVRHLEELDLSFYTGVPAASPPYPGIEGDEIWSEKNLEQAFERENVLSLSEITPYMRLIQGDAVLKNRLALARKRGKLVEGHTTGANLEKLNALAVLGITSCHESLTAEDALNRLRLGYYVMLRQGSIRRELPRLAEAVRQIQHFDTSRLMLVTDGIFPDHLVSWGNMDWVITEAINNGIDPIRAIQMATINPARYFRLDRHIGGIAPGRLAHVLVVDNLESPTPRLVMARGKIVAQSGKLLGTPSGPPADCQGMGNRPFQITGMSPGMFEIPCRDTTQNVPVIRIIDQTVTDIEMHRIPTSEGVYRPRDDILAAILTSRDGRKIGRGFIAGFCDGLGAIASTIAHETHGLLVLGQSPPDMARAANRVLEMDGGISLVHHGDTRAEIAFPMGGICSLKPVRELAEEIRHLHRVLLELGCSLQYPLWTMGFLSFTSVLKARITYEGVFDIKAGQIIFP
jgi:adenine deaminase